MGNGDCLFVRMSVKRSQYDRISGGNALMQDIRLKATGLEGASGTLTGTLPNGAECRGNWASPVSTANRTMVDYRWNARNGLATMLTQRRGVQPGMNSGRAFLSCSDGTRIDIEFVTGTAKRGYGEACDNNGNVYRFII